MSKKGALEERQVVKTFTTYGYGAIRVPASGARTKDDKPDVIAGNSRNYYAVEVKSSKNDYIYIREEQVEELLRFSALFGAKPLICVKFTRKPYVVFNPYHLKRTKSGKYTVHRGDVEGAKLLTDFLDEEQNLKR